LVGVSLISSSLGDLFAFGPGDCNCTLSKSKNESCELNTSKLPFSFFQRLWQTHQEVRGEQAAQAFAADQTSVVLMATKAATHAIATGTNMSAAMMAVLWFGRGAISGLVTISNA
jgi:hypothetical protein